MEYKIDKLSNHLMFKNGKKKSTYTGKIPIYGGNGILGYSKEFNQENNIIIGRVGAYCGSVYYEKNRCWVSDNAISAVCLKNTSNIIYFYYLLKSINLNKLRIGTSQPLITQDILKNIEINIAGELEQKKISSVLGNLDNKIEINNKIIANLESQAQAIFKSWFVDFEPFQDGEFVESELGMIPKGWDVVQLGNSRLGVLIGSGIDEFDGEKTYLATADVDNTRFINLATRITFENRPSRANMQPSNFSIWFAKMKNSRKLISVNELDNTIIENMIFSTGFAGIKCDHISFYYLWTYLLSKEFDDIKNSYCQGTTMQAINNSNINKILIKLPLESILSNFSKIVEPMFKDISRLNVQNQKLAQIRDTLLPKLMSGEIDVSNIKIDIEEDNND